MTILKEYFPSINNFVMLIAISFSMLIIESCSASSPPLKRDMGPDEGITPRQSLERKYPRKSYITSWGISKKSWQEAKLNAKSQISAQIRSSIESRTESFASAVSVNGEVTDYQRLVSEVKTETEFSRNELIRIDPDSRYEKNGTYYVFGYISRRKLYNILKEDYEDQSSIFQKNITTLSNLKNDLQAYSTAYTSVRSSYNKMAAKACQMQAVTGKDFNKFNADRDSLRNADRDRIKLLQSVRVAVRMDNKIPEIDNRRVLSAFRKAFVNMGVSAVRGSCENSDYLLELKLDLLRKSTIGRIYELSIRGDLKKCGDGEVMTEVSISGPSLRGDGMNAISEISANITAEVLKPMLFSSISHVLPVR